VSILKAILTERQTQEFLIKLNTRDQLFDKGEGSDGVKLEDIGGPYKDNTIYGVPGQYPGKLELGLPIDRITLFQTGEFYESFRIEINLPYIDIFADDLKDGVRLTERWGNNILGLNATNKLLFTQFLENRVIDNLFNIILS